MAHFQVPTAFYMTRDVVSIAPDDSLEQAYRVATEEGVSALPVTDGGLLVGMVSLTDLLRVGRREAGSAVRASALTFPARAVGEEMTRDVQTVTPETWLSEAAGVMRKAYIHRLFVTEDDELVGVLSTTDLMKAIEEQKLNHPVGDYMSSPVFTIRDQEPLGEALERLDRGHASGLVVQEDGWPVGVFSKTEALEARELPRSVAVGDVMSPRILVLPPSTSMHRAAAQARALGVKRVIIQEVNEVKGILSGLDFARAVT